MVIGVNWSECGASSLIFNLKRGAARFLALEGEAPDAALELEEDSISSKDSVKIILKGLDKLNKKDNMLSKFQA